MLVLSRRAGGGESIMITKDGFAIAEIFITSIDRNQVKVGINAPKNVNIMRNELIQEDVLAEQRSQF